MPKTASPKPKAAKRETVNSTILGAAAEHFVMCQLLRQDMIAALAPAGVPNADIIVSDRVGSKLAAIQVKGRRDLGQGGWPMKAKHEGLDERGLIYCFVDFGKTLFDRPQCWIVPSAVVADVLTRSHRTWLARPGRAGQAHKENDLRRFTRAYGPDDIGKPHGWLDEFYEAWHLIKGAAT